MYAGDVVPEVKRKCCSINDLLIYNDQDYESDLQAFKIAVAHRTKKMHK